MDWREKNARDISSKITFLPDFIQSFLSSCTESSEMTIPDLWLEGQIQLRIMNISSNLDSMRTKSGFQEAFYSYWNDLKYYASRTEAKHQSIANYAVETWIKLLAPFLIYTVEEVNVSSGGTKLVCESRFPVVDVQRIHPEAQLYESLIQRLVEDSSKILRLMPVKPSSLHIYVATPWLYDLFSSLAGARGRNEKTSESMKEFFATHSEIDRKLISNVLGKVSKTLNELGDSFIGKYNDLSELDETRAYKESVGYLERRLGVKIAIHDAFEENKYDPKNKTSTALPFKPALYFE